MQTDENIVKSIIYGSPIQTSYGLFRSLCSAINHKGKFSIIIKIILIKSYFIFETIITSKNIINLCTLLDFNKSLMIYLLHKVNHKDFCKGIMMIQG